MKIKLLVSVAALATMCNIANAEEKAAAATTTPAPAASAAAKKPTFGNTAPQPATAIVKIDGKTVVTGTQFNNMYKKIKEEKPNISYDEAYGAIIQTLVSEKMMDEMVAKAQLEKDPKYVEYISQVTNQAKRNWVMRKEAEKYVTEDMIRQFHAELIKAWGDKKEAMFGVIFVTEDKDAEGKVTKTAEAKANEAHGKIDAAKGANFSEIAKQYSSHEETKNKDNASVGRYLIREEMSKEMADVVFALKSKGDVSKPVKTDEGYVIIKLLETARSRPAPSLSDPKVREAVKEQAVMRLAPQVQAQMFGNSKIELFDLQGKPITPATEAPAPAATPIEKK